MSVELLAQELDELDSEIRKLKEETLEKQQSRYELFAKYAELKWNVKEGSIVETTPRKHGYGSTARIVTDRFLVVAVRDGGLTYPPSLTARLIRKDGTPGVELRYIYRDWKVVT